MREIKSKDQENDVWAPMSRDEPSFLAQMGVMEGMTEHSTSRNLELLPTFTAIKFGAPDETAGRCETGDTEPDAGLNVKYGVTSNLIADVTVNPDFSQIESDRPQIEVNRRFPLFFPERRPFFLEGAEIFSVRGPVAFVHTRTIVDPRLGAKLSGKAGSTALGVLFADDEAPGNFDDPTGVGFGQTAKTFIGRVKHDLYTESHIGGMFTNRLFDFDGVLQDENTSAGVEFEFANSLSLGVHASRDLERFEGLDFIQNRVNVEGRVNTNRAVQLGAGFNVGDQLFFDVENPFLGRGLGGISARPCALCPDSSRA